MERPKTQYALSGDVNIAYCRSASGPIDVVLTPGFTTHIELQWEPPFNGALFDRIARFARVAVLDKRGTGLSDRMLEPATIEQRMDDLRAVMDAEGIERAAMIGISEGAAMSAVFAATYPERVSSLVLWSAGAGPSGGDEARNFMLPWIEEKWGTGEIMSVFVRVGNQPDIERLGQLERYSATPRMACALASMNIDIDIRDILPVISVPTLVLHRSHDIVAPRDRAIALAELIPGARRVELPGNWHLNLIAEAEAPALDIVEEFITGAPPMADTDRVLSTVLFTDIVDSTRRASDLGDRRWRELLDAHDHAVSTEVTRHRGVVVKTTGDGVLARFDGPARAIRCAQAIIDATARIELDVRAGLHTGECEIRGDDVAGIAVHIGARISALAGASEVLVSSTVRDLVAGGGINFADRGRHSLKGVPGDWQVYAVER